VEIPRSTQGNGYLNQKQGGSGAKPEDRSAPGFLFAKYPCSLPASFRRSLVGDCRNYYVYNRVFLSFFLRLPSESTLILSDRKRL